MKKKTWHSSRNKILIISALIFNGIMSVSAQFTNLQNRDSIFYDDIRKLIRLGQFDNAIDLLSSENSSHLQQDDYSKSIKILQLSAKCYYFKGDYTKSYSLIDVALFLFNPKTERDSILYASLLSDFAYYNYKTSKMEKAVELEKESMAITEIVEGKECPNYAKSLAHLCDFYGDLGNYDSSISSGEKALDILKSTIGVNNEYYERASTMMSYNYLNTGEFNRSIELLKPTIELCIKIHGNNHPNLALLYTHLSYALCVNGSYHSAINYGNLAIDIYERINNVHPDYAYVLNNQSLNYYYIGDLPKACKLMQQALDIRKTMYGIQHPYYLRSLGNMGSLYMKLGDYVNANKFINEGLFLCEIVSGKNLQYGDFLHYMSNLNSDEENYNKAFEYQYQHLDIVKKFCGENHADYLYSLESLAELHFKVKEYDDAIKIIRQALTVGNRIYHGSSHVDLVSPLLSLSKYLRHRGNLKEAMSTAKEAKKVALETVGDDSQEYFSALIEIIRCRNLENNIDVDEICEYDNSERGKLLSNISRLSTNQRKYFWSINNSWFLNELPILASKYNKMELNRLLFNNIITTKGILLSSNIEISKLLERTGSKEVMDRYDEFRNCQDQLSYLLKLPIQDRFLNVDSLRYVSNQLESYLIDKCQEYGNYTHNLSSTWQDVQHELKDGDLMVEFFAFQDADSVKQYAALTLDNKDKAPHFYNLFKEIELRSLDSKQLYYSTDLYNILWGKITKELKNKSRIYFSPCEGLYDIAIESLPVDSTHYISDLYDMYRLTSSRVILNKTSIPKSGNAVVFGGLNYTISSDEVLKQKRFSYLPGTKVEAEDVAEKLSQGNYKVSLITDNLGTESSFKSISGAELDLLHIATHGFYLNKDYQSTRQNKLEFLYVSNDSQSMEEEKAMSRSGLVFAGVNNFFNVGDSTKNANEDGFLTAVEISNLDLSRVKLVVLSACQTGLGDESGTEIYGLQRGFKLAGAKSIMMSLWKVDDYATQLLMESFYKSLMNEESPVLALKKAKMAVRKTYPSPRYWAPFIIVD